MEFGEAIQTILAIVFFILRILIPAISIGVLIGCFVSHRRGRRAEEPVVFLEDLNSGSHIPVLYWENSIGRSKSCDITIRDQTVSRDHAVLMRRESGWFIVDTQSKGGVFVNGKPFQKEAPIKPGDVITLGMTHLCLKRVTDVEVPGELFSDSDRRTAMRVQRSRMKQAPNPAKLLAGVTVVQILLGLQLVFGTGKLVLEPLISLAGLIAITWIFYGISRKALRRVSFEIETVGMLLSSIGILLLTGKDMQPNYTQLIGLCIGIVFYCFLIWFMKSPDRVMKARLWIGIAALLLFVINLVFAKSIYGARNWILIGPFSFQPSEFIKIAYIFVGAAVLSKLQTTRNLGAFLIFTALCMGALVLMKDFGSAAIFFVTFLVIAFMRSGSLRTIVLILAGVAFAAFLAVTFIPHIAERFSTWRHVWEMAGEGGWQQANAMMYAASGGFFGLGLGNGYNISSNFAGDSDVVFASICEEMGLIMGVVILLGLAMLILMARSDVTRSRSTFYSICGCAAAGLFLFQACLNVFGTVDILPLTGVTLPFISAGGTSIVAVWGLLAFCKAADERTYAVRRPKSAARVAVPVGAPPVQPVAPVQPAAPEEDVRRYEPKRPAEPVDPELQELEFLLSDLAAFDDNNKEGGER